MEKIQRTLRVNMTNNIIIPSHLQIETINGACTSRCIMCPVFLEPKRKFNILNIADYTTILNKFRKFNKEDIKYISLFGYGEPLLDKDIVEKVRIAKEMGFKGIGFPTNCTELDERMSTDLINNGIDTVICSIDGNTKEIHESIKVGTKFENIVHNVKTLINVRNELYEKNDKIKTKILIRFIYQEINKHEWNDFYKYWKLLLNKKFDDDVVKFNVHNCGGLIKNYNITNVKTSYVCSYIFERFIIYSDGSVPFCCGDNGEFPYLGNVLHDDPIEIFNNEIYTKYRKFMKEGKIQELDNCKTCTVVLSKLQSM